MSDELTGVVGDEVDGRRVAYLGARTTGSVPHPQPTVRISEPSGRLRLLGVVGTLVVGIVVGLLVETP